MIRDLLTLGDILTVAGIALPIVGGFFLYFRKRLDKIQDNHLAHLDEKIDGVSEKVDSLSADFKLFIGRWDGYELPERVTRLERLNAGHVDE